MRRDDVEVWVVTATSVAVDPGFFFSHRSKGGGPSERVALFLRRPCPEIASDLNSGGIYIFLFVCQLRSRFMCSHGDFDGVLNVLLVSCVSGLCRGVRKRVLPHSMQNQGTRSNSSTETKSIKLFFKTQHQPQRSY